MIDVISAHKHSSEHYTEIMASDICGCFYFFSIFKPVEIEEWVVEDCAICPKCNIDSVIGAKSGYPITKDFLAKMHKHWF